MKISILAAIVASIFLTSNAFGEQSLYEAYEELSEVSKEFQEKTETKQGISSTRSILEEKNFHLSNFKVEITAQGDIFLASDQYMCRFFRVKTSRDFLECYERQAPYKYELWRSWD